QLPAGLPGAEAACTERGAAMAKATVEAPLPPLVTVIAAAPRQFRQTLFVSGTLVARDEAIVGAQIDGLRIVEVLADD
ncbi:hypothetical protein J8J27_34985, partial [Mycobacterium tuberculosis]|nr:hypothetical protein [Mycobacterium tuberculosis]